MIKNLAKKSAALRYLVHRYRNAAQNAAIAREQRYYEARFNPSRVPNATEIMAHFCARLNDRGVSWPPIPHDPVKIIFATPRGNWELENIPPEIAALGTVVPYVLEMRGISRSGGSSTRNALHADLLPFLAQEQKRSPVTLFLSYLSGAHLARQTLMAIKNLGIACVGFHFDDRLSFNGRKIDDEWSGPAALCNVYDLNLTNAPRSQVKYFAEGGEALFWPEAANPALFAPSNNGFEFDVTFIGACYGERPYFINALHHAGVNVACFGEGWRNGKVSAQRMAELFSRSRVVLGSGFVLDSDDQCLKGRDFEVPMCGAAYLTSYHSDLSRVYRLGQEIESYRSIEECIAKVRLLLSDDSMAARLRSSALSAAYTRHRWLHRVQMLLKGCAVDYLLPFPASDDKDTHVTQR